MNNFNKDFNAVNFVVNAINENVVPLGEMIHIDTEAIKDGGDLFAPYRLNTVVADNIWGDYRCLYYESEQYTISLLAIEIHSFYKETFDIELQMAGILGYLLEDLSFYKVEHMVLPFLEMSNEDFSCWESGVLDEVAREPEFLQSYTNKIADSYNSRKA